MSTKKFGIVAGIALTLSVVVSPAFAACSLTTLSECDNNGLMALVLQLLAGSQTQTGTGTGTITGIPAGFTFTTNLAQGSTGNDVKYLQILLNSDTATSVGNKGSETTYFGSMTKAAVVKFQNKYTSEVLAPYGLAAGTGFFGTASRAKANALIAAGVGTGTGTGTTTPVTGGFTVSLASDSPVSGTVIVGQGIADLAHINLSNGTSSEVKITTLKLRRLGVSADATLSKIYLYDGNTRLSDEAVVSSGVITWNNSTGVITIPANTVKTIAVKSDIAALVSGSAPTGQTVGVGITSAADITSNATAISGTFPINGNIFTTAAATLASFSFGATTTPSANTALDPQNEFIMFQNTVTVGTRAVNLKSITFRNIGSTSVNDLQSLKLLVDGTQVGSTLTSTDSAGYFTFDLSAAPKKLETGTRTFKVVGNVVGGSTRDFTISIYKASDVVVTDNEYNVNVLVLNNNATFSPVSAGKQTVAAGNLTITKRTDSPTSNIVEEASQVTLAKYDLKATGEAIKIENLRVSFAATPGADAVDTNSITELRNGALFVDGVQVGSTMTLNEDTNSPAFTEFSLGSSLIVTPGTTRVLEIKADIHDQDGTDNITTGSTIQALLVVGSLNYQKMVSGGYANTPVNSNAYALTVANGTLSMTKDQSYGSQTIVVPQTAQLLGKFNLSAGTSEDVNLNTINVAFTFGAGDLVASTDLTNVYIKYGDKTTSSLSTIAAETVNVSTNSFSISKTLVRGQNLIMEVYGDVGSTAGATGTIVTGLEVEGTTVSSGATVYANATQVSGGAKIAGQQMTISAGGNLTVTLDNSTPLASQVVAGETPTIGALKVKLAAANEDLYVKNVVLRVNTSANSAAIASIDLYAAQGTGAFTKIGETKVLSNDGTNPGYVSWAMSGTDRIQVLKNGATYLLAKPTYVSSGQTAVTGTTPAIYLADVKADGTAGTLTAKDSTGSDLVVESGILIGSATPTFVADATATSYTALGATTSMTANGNPTTDRTGSFVLIDMNADGTYDNGTDEIAYCVECNTSNATFTLQRGALGTTAISDAAGNIYFLTGVNGNAQTVLNTKLALSLGSDSPSGSTTGAAGKVVFTFDAAAANNASDPAENKAVLTMVDITTTESLATVNNLKLYPSEYDNNVTYVTTCSALSASKWRCVMSTAGGSNEIIENTSRKYIARADVGYSGAGNVLVSIATLGTSNVATNDVTWTDGTTSEAWVNQATSSIQGGAQTTGGASGTADTTAPTIASLVFGGTADNILDNADTITITFSEIIDPSTINASLLPGGAAVTPTNATTGDVSMDAAGVVTVTNIATTDVDGGAASATTYAPTYTLDATGKILTITLAGKATGTGALSAGEVFGDVVGLTTTVKDTSAVTQADSAVNASGDI
ncbi:MAG: peptidoglycan-binding domain-containing protein [Minisyncoccales bacterium]